MGCDIHFYVEQKSNEEWRSIDKWEVDPYGEGDGRLGLKWDAHFYHRRNYDLFAILADVRNGYGFAGCDTGDGFKPIDKPRGLPIDVSPEVKAESDRWGVDGHSHSYFTLAELKNYDWDGQKTKHRGYVNALEFQEWRVKGRPQSWCGGISGGSVRILSNKEMEEMIEKKVCLEHAYTKVEWEESYADAVYLFLTETMPKLEAASYGDPTSIRIVFWFDN